MAEVVWGCLPTYPDTIVSRILVGLVTVRSYTWYSFNEDSSIVCASSLSGLRRKVDGESRILASN